METIDLSIFHTNDMRGRMEAITRLSSFARRLRTEVEAEGRRTFFWDAGDAADRRVSWCSISKGAAFSDILNAMGYTLQTMGNAIALPYGPQAMDAVTQRANFPVLAANFRDGDGPPVGGAQETVFLRLPRALSMGVIGLTSPWQGMYEVFGLHFPDYLKLTGELVAKMKAQNAHLVVILSHLGLDEDRRLAEAIPDIDLIIGAHSHNYLPNGEEHNGVLIAQAGEYASALGRVDITLEVGSGKVLARSAQVLDVPQDESPDPLVLAAIASAEQEADQLKGCLVGMLEEPLDMQRFAECDIGNLTADALRERMRADAAIVSSGMFHRGLSRKTVTLGHLNDVCFSTANPCVTQVRGEQILAALERGLDPEFNKMTPQGFRGAPVGIPQISGMAVEYAPNAETGRRVKRVNIQGEALVAQRLYRLAHTDAENNRMTGCLKLDRTQETEQEVPIILREVIGEHIRKYSPVAKPKRGRWAQVNAI